MDCNLYFFTGFDYKQSGKIRFLGGNQEKYLVLSDVKTPLEEKSEVLMPYKRTEYGKKLISKERVC